MGERQRWRCAICGRNLQTHGYVVDHCHRTSRVRGLLCAEDNQLAVRLDPAFLLVNIWRLAEYLESDFDGRSL
jgi:hypothetical protein